MQTQLSNSSIYSMNTRESFEICTSIYFDYENLWTSATAFLQDHTGYFTDWSVERG